MRRRIGLAPVLAIAALALASCEMRAEVVVNPDGSGTMGMRFGVPKALFAMMPSSEDPFAEAREDFGNDPVEWKVEEYENDAVRGIHATFAFSSIEDLQAKMRQLDEANQSGSEPSAFDEFSLERTTTGWSFRAKADGFSMPEPQQGVNPFDGTDMPPGGFGGDGSFDGPTFGEGPSFDESFNPEQMMDAFTIEFHVTLPGAAADTNATRTVKGDGSTTFVWKVSEDLTEMTAETRGFGGGGIPTRAVGIAAAALLIGGIGTALMLRRRSSGGGGGGGDPLLEGLLVSSFGTQPDAPPAPEAEHVEPAVPQGEERAAGGLGA